MTSIWTGAKVTVGLDDLSKCVPMLVRPRPRRAMIRRGVVVAICIATLNAMKPDGLPVISRMNIIKVQLAISAPDSMTVNMAAL